MNSGEYFLDRFLCTGIDENNNEWEGYFVEDYGDYYIICGENKILIDPKTLRQSTGVRDKYGWLIFDGDRLIDTLVGDSFIVEWCRGEWVLQSTNPNYSESESEIGINSRGYLFEVDHDYDWRSVRI